MNTHQDHAHVDEAAATYSSRTASQSLTPFGQIVSTLLISIVIYYSAPLLPIWPEYTKRAIWEAIVFLTPSQVIYVMDHGLARLFGYGTEALDIAKFQRSDFGNKDAKSDALKRLLHLDGQYAFTPASGAARALSSLGSSFKGVHSDLPAGLGNWDNSCYQNSIIQGLAALQSLEEFVDRNIEEAGTSEGLNTHEALKTIINKLNDKNNNGKSLWTPLALKSMSSWQQQDAQEYFTKILDEVEKEGKRIKNAVRYHMTLASPLENLVQKMQGDGSDVEQQKSRSERRTGKNGCPLEGLLAQRVGCTRCGFCEGLSLIPFTFLTVPLPRRYESDIRECLDEYTAFEKIEGVECSKCSVLRLKEQLERLVSQNEALREKSNHSQDVPGFIEIAKSRLLDIQNALRESDYSDNTVTKTLKVNKQNRVTTVKSRQAVIARAPRALALHVNRSVFDEMTGEQYKNTAAVHFPTHLDISEWCIGTVSGLSENSDREEWESDPSRSMRIPGSEQKIGGLQYELKALVTHQGRHENGHYVAYRKRPWRVPSLLDSSNDEMDQNREYHERWFRFSDESVSMASEEQVLAQGGAFMLFYEAVEDHVRIRGGLRESEVASAQNMSEQQAPIDDVTEPTRNGEVTADLENMSSSVSLDKSLIVPNITPESYTPGTPDSGSSSPARSKDQHLLLSVGVGSSADLTPSPTDSASSVSQELPDKAPKHIAAETRMDSAVSNYPSPPASTC